MPVEPDLSSDRRVQTKWQWAVSEGWLKMVAIVVICVGVYACECADVWWVLKGDGQGYIHSLAHPFLSPTRILLTSSPEYLTFPFHATTPSALFPILFTFPARTG